jgi:type II secretory pathway component PulM
MMEPLLAWFRGRTQRERLLLQVGAFILVFVAGPLWAWTAASAYRERSARDLDAAVALQRDQARLATLRATSPAPAQPASDGSARGLAMALALEGGIRVSRIEPDGPTGLQASFEPASALAVYRWIDGMERGGFPVNSVAMTRSGEGDIVVAQVRVAGSR